MNKKNLAKFKLEILFQNFLSCFPGMTDSEDVIDMLRDFFYAGAGEIMILQLYPPKGMTNEKKREYRNMGNNNKNVFFL